jgi:rare lipoprotein A
MAAPTTVRHSHAHPMKKIVLPLQVLIVSAAALLGTCFASEPAAAAPAHRHKIDHSGHKQVGKASFYARKFAHRKMADGTRMNPRENIAASKTLPLGTVAKVTNLHTGQSTVVTIHDRGPHVRGRIVDLSPAAAEKIGLTAEEGIAPVEVAPIAVPLPDGSVKPGEGATPG